MMKNQGFTLIELIIVIAIIGILAAIAYPSYTQYKVRTNRVDVQSEMMGIAQRLQSFYVINHNYTSANLAGIGGSATYPTTSPVFDIVLTTTAQAWTLSATPKSGTVQAGNGVICLNNQGQKDWNKATATAMACIARLSNTSNWEGR